MLATGRDLGTDPGAGQDRPPEGEVMWCSQANGAAGC